MRDLGIGKGDFGFGNGRRKLFESGMNREDGRKGLECWVLSCEWRHHFASVCFAPRKVRREASHAFTPSLHHFLTSSLRRQAHGLRAKGERRKSEGGSGPRQGTGLRRPACVLPPRSHALSERCRNLFNSPRSAVGGPDSAPDRCSAPYSPTDSIAGSPSRCSQTFSGLTWSLTASPSAGRTSW